MRFGLFGLKVSGDSSLAAWGGWGFSGAGGCCFGGFQLRASGLCVSVVPRPFMTHFFVESLPQGSKGSNN